MSLDITTFTSNFSGGGVRPNLFRVHIPALGDKFQFTCKASSMPASNIGITEVPYMGRILKLAGNRTFDDWNVTVLLDTDYSVKNELEAWMNTINTHEGNIGAVQVGEYFYSAQVEMLDRDGAVLKTYEMNDIWPTVMAEVVVDWSSNDEIAEMEVTFAIGTYWSSNTTS